MYRVLKEKGNNTNVALENTETKATLIIGKLTMDIVRLLEKEGYTFDPDKEGGVGMRDSWTLGITDDTAKELSKMTMSIHKPIRDQRKPKEEAVKKDNKHINALDVLLGLAHYN